MSSFLDALVERMNGPEITVNELLQMERLIAQKLPGFKITRVSVKNQIKIQPGSNSNVPINPFSQYEYPMEEYQALWDYYADEKCGQFASRNQWAGIGRTCKGKPLMVRKMYGNNVEYFAFKQTECSA